MTRASRGWIVAGVLFVLLMVQTVHAQVVNPTPGDLAATDGPNVVAVTCLVLLSDGEINQSQQWFPTGLITPTPTP